MSELAAAEAAALVHLNNAGASPLAAPALVAMQELMLKLASQGYHARMAALAAQEGARRALATLTGTLPAQVALTPSCSAGLSLLAAGIPLKAGDEVLSLQGEYSSVIYAWQAAAARAGATLRLLPRTADLGLNVQEVLAAVGPRTRVVVLSWVQSDTGAAFSLEDLARLARRCREANARLIVDGYQGLGVLPFSLQETGVDAVAGGAHKWLAAAPGLGFLAFRDSWWQELPPLVHGAGAYGTPDDPFVAEKAARADIKRFEGGTPSFILAAGLMAATEAVLLRGLVATQEQITGIRAELEAALRQAGAVILGGPSARTTGILTFLPQGEVKVLSSELWRRGISHVSRSGRIRFSPHVFTTPSDVAAALAVFAT